MRADDRRVQRLSIASLMGPGVETLVVTHKCTPPVARDPGSAAVVLRLDPPVRPCWCASPALHVVVPRAKDKVERVRLPAHSLSGVPRRGWDEASGLERTLALRIGSPSRAAHKHVEPQKDCGVPRAAYTCV